MANGISSFLNVNGMDFPCPHDGFQYVYSQAVDAGRNAKGEVVSQLVGRGQYKFDNLEWIGLFPYQWQSMMAALEPFFVPVTFEDMTGQIRTITMYHGDITCKPLFVNPQTHLIERYEYCKVNLIDCGRDD